MGLGIYKALGWGIDDVIVDANDNRKVIDSRFNPSSVVFSYENREKFIDEAYLDHIKELVGEPTIETVLADKDGFFVSKFMVEEMRNSNSSFGHQHMILDGMIHQPLDNQKSVVLIIPPGNFDTWFHNDSPIDCYESVANAVSGTPFAATVKKLSKAPYPYSGIMNAKTGEKIDNYLARAFLDTAKPFSITDDNLSVIENVNYAGYYDIVLEAAIKLGFNSIEDAVENLVPCVPGDVRDVAAWTNLFADDTAWKDLRPMVFTYRA
jgi:hypothetical protein